MGKVSGQSIFFYEAQSTGHLVDESIDFRGDSFASDSDSGNVLRGGYFGGYFGYFQVLRFAIFYETGTLRVWETSVALALHEDVMLKIPLGSAKGNPWSANGEDMSDTVDNLEGIKDHEIELENDCQEQESLSKTEPAFYRDAASYWSQVPATVDGVLGGYGHVSSVDVQGSERFLRALSQRPDRLLKERALDCGAGVGRVTKEFLKDHFKIVDLVEQDFHFLEAAKTDLSSTGHKGRFFCQGLQNFQPEEGYYDVIWSQWVLGHLVDIDLVKFFERCKIGLRPKGYLVIKENVTASGEVEMDHTDSSVTRPLNNLIDLVKKAGYQLVHQQKQQRFPKDLYQVYMLAFKPNKP